MISIIKFAANFIIIFMIVIKVIIKVFTIIIIITISIRFISICAVCYAILNGPFYFIVAFQKKNFFILIFEILLRS